MAKLFVFFFICFGSVYSKTQIEKNLSQDTISEKMDTVSILQPSIAKIKRFAWPLHTTPCPIFWPQYNKSLQMTQKYKLQFIQQPTYSVKSVHQNWQSTNPLQQNSNWKQNEWPMPSNGWLKPSYRWTPISIGWLKPINEWYKPSNKWQSSNMQSSDWQPKVIVQKPEQFYLPQYQKPLNNQIPNYQYNLIKPTMVMSDCPSYIHQHLHQTGIVYASQQQYNPLPQIQYVHHEPQYTKMTKPNYQSPLLTYHPFPLYHHSQSVQTPQVGVCD